MPTYEYACRECGEHLEVVQSFADAPLTTCGRCGGSLRKVFSAAGIIFKGSGYYVTDTRSAAKKASDAGAKKSEGDSGSSAGKADSAPAAKGDGGSQSSGKSDSAGNSPPKAESA